MSQYNICPETGEKLYCPPHVEFGPSRTKQSFKDETDINRIIARHGLAQTISHLAKFENQYGDYTEWDDLLDAHSKLSKGTAIFDELPGEVKREFNQNPGEFFAFVNNPANKDKLHLVLPELARPGTQMPRASKTKGHVDTAERKAAEVQAQAPQPPQETGASEAPSQ